jgi:hypothetical protein
MITRITTESGSVYEINNGVCKKNGVIQFLTLWAYCFEEEGSPEGSILLHRIPNPFEDSDTSRRLPIQVGKRLYIGGVNGYWITSQIISIESGVGNNGSE